MSPLNETAPLSLYRDAPHAERLGAGESFNPSPAREESGAPLRILLASYRSNRYSGGQGVYVHYLSRALADLGHRVDVISGPPYPELDPRVRLIELPSLDLYADGRRLTAFRPGFLRQPLDLYEWAAHVSGAFPEPYTFGERLARYLVRHGHEYDVVHDNQTLAPGFLKVRDRQRLPVVSTIHHPITRDRRIALQHTPNPWFKLLTRRWFSFLSMQMRVARRLDHVLAVSESTKRDVITDFGVDPGAVTVVHNGVDTDFFRPLGEVARHRRRLIATASADVPLKGLSYLIRAYAMLLAEFPDLELYVVGSLRKGPTEQLLSRLGIEGRVHFLSRLEQEEIVRHYAKATLAVVPSVYEGFGLPAAEAMACGVPLVATDGGALPEVVGDAGLIVPHSDAAALAQALAHLLRAPAERARLGAAGRARMLSCFTWETAARRTAALYREAIARAHGRSQPA